MKHTKFGALRTTIENGLILYLSDIVREGELVSDYALMTGFKNDADFEGYSPEQYETLWKRQNVLNTRIWRLRKKIIQANTKRYAYTKRTQAKENSKENEGSPTRR